MIKDTKLRYMKGTDFQIMGVLHLLKTISVLSEVLKV